MHTGWDRSFLNKDGSKPAHTSTVSDASASAVSAKSTPLPPKTGTSGATSTATSAKSTAATTSTGNNELSAAQAHESSEEANLEDIHPDALEYSHLSTTDIVKIKAFLKSHTHIINPQQKDSLLMKAFDSQLEGNVPRTKQIIFLSTLLQYIYDIIEFKRARHPQEIQIIVEQLLGKMFTGAKNPALDAFEGEVGRTYQHIKERCEVISRESVEEGEGVEEIQLKSLDDSVELVVNLPNENSSDPKEVERYQIFKTLPESMQAALKTGQLDEVNKVFHGIPIDEAENILEIFDQCEVIGVQALIDNEADWKEIKNEYESQFGDENAPDPSKYHNVEAPKIEELDIKEERFETGDIVD
jgi:cell division cycle protein 37